MRVPWPDAMVRLCLPPDLLKSAPSRQRSPAADYPSDIVCDSLPLCHSTTQLFILLDRRCSSSVSGGLNIFTDTDDIDPRAAFKLHRTHQTVDTLDVHCCILTCVAT